MIWRFQATHSRKRRLVFVVIGGHHDSGQRILPFPFIISSSMAAKNKEFVIDIKSAIDLEKQLEYSHHNTFVAVLDIYSSEWGPCKAIYETFSRLRNDFGDDKVRFFSVECNLVLEALRTPSDELTRHHQQRAKAGLPADVLKDTAPETWEPILNERRGRSKPFFGFYKGGRLVQTIDGVNTPAVRALVKDLCAVKTPAADLITNLKLLEFWDDHFVPEESEVAWDKFVKALSVTCGWKVPLSDEERLLMWEALGINKDAKERTVTADALQKWVGDDEARTVPQAFSETVPKYEERATKVLQDQADEDARVKKQRDEEAAERQRHEKEEAEKQEKAKAEKAAADEDQRKKDAEAAKGDQASSDQPAGATKSAPSDSASQDGKPAEAAKPAEGQAAASEPAAAADAKPADAKPAEKPADAPPAEAAEAKPAETKPAEAKPAEAAVENKPAEHDAKPAEAKPADAKPA